MYVLVLVVFVILFSIYRLSFEGYEFLNNLDIFKL